MPRFTDLETEFVCPYRHGCPYLEGHSTQWIWEQTQATAATHGQYEYLLAQQDQEIAQLRAQNRKLE